MSKRLGSAYRSGRVDHWLKVKNPTAPAVALYDGQLCIGFLFSRGKSGIEAFDADEHSLGIFPNQRSAANAIQAAGAEA